MVAREGFRYAALLQQRHTKYGRIRGMVVGEGGRSTGVLLYYKKNGIAPKPKLETLLFLIPFTERSTFLRLLKTLKMEKPIYEWEPWCQTDTMVTTCSQSPAVFVLVVVASCLRGPDATSCPRGLDASPGCCCLDGVVACRPSSSLH